MTAVIIALVCLGLLALNELWWRRFHGTSELSRKFVHIVAGSFVALWPYFLSWSEIRGLSLAALLVVLLSKYFKLFRTIHILERDTWGEICFALAVGATTFITHNKAIYAAALLQMGLADGLAAVVGRWLGKGNTYKVLGATKSLAGTAAFIFVGYTILLSASIFSLHITIPWCLAITLIAALVENVAIRGTDNLLVPLLVAVMLRLAT